MMPDSIVEVKNVTKSYKRDTMEIPNAIALSRCAPLFLFVLFCVAAAGCSNSSSPNGGNNNNNNNNNGGNAIGVVGPSIGTVYLLSITEKDTTGAQLTGPIYDTALVVANTVTFEGRTNVTKILNKFYDPNLYPSPTRYFDTGYYGYDTSGDFYIYDTTYPHPGWHHYPTGSKTTTLVKYDPRPFGTDTIVGFICNRELHRHRNYPARNRIDSDGECSRNFLGKPSAN